MNAIENIVNEFQGELRVSSEAIASGVGAEHRSVLQLIGTHEESLERFGPLAFEMRPLPGGGNPVRVAHLSEPQVTLLMTFMKNSAPVVTFKVAVVEEFYRMRQALIAPQHALPQTYSEALRELAATAEKNTDLAQKIIVDEPKVEYVDTFVADGDLRLLRNVAKSLGMTEGELRGDLLARKWIYAEHVTRWSETKQCKEPVTRYSPYSHKAEYFEPVPNHLAPRFKGEVMHTLKTTPAGAVAIARLYGKHLQALEAVSA